MFLIGASSPGRDSSPMYKFIRTSFGSCVRAFFFVNRWASVRPSVVESIPCRLILLFTEVGARQQINGGLAWLAWPCGRRRIFASTVAVVHIASLLRRLHQRMCRLLPIAGILHRFASSARDGRECRRCRHRRECGTDRPRALQLWPRRRHVRPVL